jgi:hypothetical protein
MDFLAKREFRESLADLTLCAVNSREFRTEGVNPTVSKVILSGLRTFCLCFTRAPAFTEYTYNDILNRLEMPNLVLHRVDFKLTPLLYDNLRSWMNWMEALMVGSESLERIEIVIDGQETDVIGEDVDSDAADFVQAIIRIRSMLKTWEDHLTDTRPGNGPPTIHAVLRKFQGGTGALTLR